MAGPASTAGGERNGKSITVPESLLDNLSDAVFTARPDGAIRTWNRGAENLYGFSAEEAVGHSSDELLRTQSRRQASDLSEEPAREGAWAGPLRRAHRTGGTVDVECRRETIRSGNEPVVLDVSHEATGPSRAAAWYRDAELLVGINSSVMDAIVVADESQRVLLFNPAAEAMFGCSAAEAIGAPIDRFIPERFRSHHHDQVRRFGETSASRRRMGELGTIFGLRANGEEFPLEASISHANVAGRKLFTVIMRDVTAARSAQKDQAALAAIVESSDDAIIGKTLDGTITAWNPAAERLYGYSLAEALGKPISLIVPPERAQELAQILETIRHKQAVDHLETVRLKKDGTRLQVSVTISPIRDLSGKVVGASAIARDISERKRNEEALLRTQKLEALGTLSRGIAHDFNNILLAISGNTKLAMMDLPLDHPAQQSLNEISKAANRATDLVRRILTFSRPQEHKREAVEIAPVVEEAIKLVRATLPASIEIRTDFAPNLPRLAVDSTEIHQVIVNLATNASHAIGSNAGLIEVRLDVTNVSDRCAAISPELKEGQYLRLSVSDNGCGMNRETIARIFDPFFTTKPAGKGTGLGLSVVHGIMKNHGGDVTVYSEPGKGTSFRLYFPSKLSGEGSAVEAGLERRRTGKSVLCVDDDEALISLTARLLERNGYAVTGYTDPSAALREFERRPGDFDVVVTDLTMQGISGWTLAQALKDVRPQLPVILLSGFVTPEDQGRAERLGVRALLQKPDDIGQLVPLLDRILPHGDEGAIETSRGVGA
jgi:PAS domain S-box-containing protein